MAHLVRGELTQAGKGHFLRLRIFVGIRRVFAHQSAGNQEVLPYPQRAERDFALDDFARARVGNAPAVRPAPAGAVYPLHEVIAGVHRVGRVGQQAHLEGVFVARRLKSLVPPRGAFHQRRADGFGRAGVEVVHDGLHGFGNGGIRVFFHQPVPPDEALHDGLAEGRGVVEVVDGIDARAGVEGPRLKAGFGQFDEREMLPQCHRAGRGCYFPQKWPRLVAGEREGNFNLGVLREIFRQRQVKRAPAGVGFITALFRSGNPGGRVVGVAEEKAGGVHEHGIALFGHHVEAPMHRLREGLLDGPALGGVVGTGAVTLIGFDE